MKSMTGYGAASGKVGRGKLYVEIKSVNHRYCEVGLKLPPKMGAIDGLVRKYLQRRFSRGKVEVFMKEKESLFGEGNLRIDTALASNYRQALKRLKEALGEKGPVELLNVVEIDRFITVEEKSGSYERLWRQIERLLAKAAQNVDKMRSVEGRAIARDQRIRLRSIQRLIERIRKQSARSLDRHMERMRSRLKGGGMMDEERLQSEISSLVNRQDITEELTRLASHTQQYGKLIPDPHGVGRKLDFLLQEMNREINTIGAKAADATISAFVVDCKAELERLREQVQNIE